MKLTDEILKKFIDENLKQGNPLNTDEWLGYKGLSKIFDHNVVKHNSKEYVKGDIHTNTIEGFWAILKRGIMGIYHSIIDIINSSFFIQIQGNFDCID